VGALPRLQPTLKGYARDSRNEPTPAEARLWRHLRLSQLDGHKFTRQMPIAGYICDFVCRRAKLIVELDGSQHGEQVAYDQARTEKVEALGYHVLRFSNHDVLGDTEAVLGTILGALCTDPSPPSPLPVGAGE